MKSSLVLFAIAAALVVCVLAPPASADLKGDLDHILATPALRGGVDGVMVADVATGKILYAHNPDTLLLPASNRKLFTGAAALALLGAEHTEVTDVLASAPISASGELDGTLILRGGGDPLLSVADLDHMAAQLALAGVKHVTGGIIADSSLFTGSRWGDGWQIDSLLAYYSPEITALEVNEGIAVISLHGGRRAGDPTTFGESPQTAYYTVDDKAVTGAPGSPVVIDIERTLPSTDITVTGSIPAGESPNPNDDDTDGRITIPDPPLYAATIFAERCRAHGVSVDGPIREGVTPAGATVLASHDSLPMSQMLGAMFKPSDNLIAECLTRLEGATASTPGSYDLGYAQENAFLRSIGIGDDTHVFADGSGVSRCDYVKPSAILHLLLYEAHQRTFATFYNAMSIVGVDGTAAHRMLGTPLVNNAHVKTGTLRNTRSLSGYVTDRGGRMLAFVMLMNNHLGSVYNLGLIQNKMAERIQRER